MMEVNKEELPLNIPETLQNSPSITTNSVQKSTTLRLYLIILTSLCVICIFAIGLMIFQPRENKVIPQKFPPKQINNKKTEITNDKQHIQVTPTKVSSPTSAPSPTRSPDNQNTLSNPTKETTIDNDHYLIVGLPKGQNNKSFKKIIFSLPGHGSTAEQDYEAWKKHITAKGDYALVSINWWDGKGENSDNYYTPVQIVEVIENYLMKNNYVPSDGVILEGFSRGSANTYSVVANDRYKNKNMIDGVISASGKYQSDFGMTQDMLNYNQGKPYSGVKWVLVCGQKDPNPTRDGCEGMSETQTFLQGKGAQILLFLKDPNGAHGAFHMSSLNFPETALKSFEENL